MKRIGLLPAVTLLSCGAFAAQQTGTYRWSANVYIDLSPLDHGFGDDGGNILNITLESFVPTFKSAFIDCVESLPPKFGSEPVVVTESDDPIFTAYQWGDDSVLRDVIPLPYQQPNHADDGFAQLINVKMPAFTVTTNAEFDKIECTEKALNGGGDRGFLDMLLEIAYYAPDSRTRDEFLGLESVAVVERTKFEEINEFRYEQKQVSGRFDIAISGNFTRDGYGPKEEAAILKALNGGLAFPVVSQAWTNDIAQKISGSHVYSVAHFLYDEDEGPRSFLPGNFLSSAPEGADIVSMKATPDFDVTIANTTGNLSQQYITEDGTIITTFMYKFWLQWWSPPGGYEEEIDGTEIAAIDALNNFNWFGALTSEIKRVDDTGYFAELGAVGFQPSPSFQQSQELNPVQQADVVVDTCDLEISIDCVMALYPETNCNDFVPGPEDQCYQQVRYTYDMNQKGARILSAERYREGSYWEEMYGNPKQLLKDQVGLKIVVNAEVSEWESDIYDFCKTATVETKFDVVTDPGSDGGELKCSKSSGYTLKINPRRSNESNDPDSSCTLDIGLTCKIGDTDIDCDDYNPAATGQPCYRTVNFIHTMKNTARFSSGNDLEFIDVYRTRPGDNTSHGERFDFLETFWGGSKTLKPSYSSVLREKPAINFCYPPQSQFETTFIAISTPNGGKTRCENSASYTIDFTYPAQ